MIKRVIDTEEHASMALASKLGTRTHESSLACVLASHVQLEAEGTMAMHPPERWAKDRLQKCHKSRGKSSICFSFTWSLTPMPTALCSWSEQLLCPQLSSPSHPSSLHMQPSLWSVTKRMAWPPAWSLSKAAQHFQDWEQTHQRAASPSQAWPFVPMFTSLHSDYASLCYYVYYCIHCSLVYVIFPMWNLKIYVPREYFKVVRLSIKPALVL